MKKVLSIILCFVLASSIALISLTADAAGWAQSARNVKLNTTFTDEFTYSDFHALYGDVSPYYMYFDSFYFSVPAKGRINLRVECETNTSRCVGYYIYPSNNIDNNIWEDNSDDAVSSGYSSGRNIYYDEWSISLNKGTYYLVAAQGDYFGLQSDTIEYCLSYRPSFANTSITSKAAKKKAFKVRWNKASNATGYQIQYSLKKNMKSSKTVTIKKQSTTAKTIKKLKSKKKYYVRVRTYKKMKVEGVNKTYYGKWSAKKTIKTK